MQKENLKSIVIFFALTLGILTDYLFYGITVGISFFVFISIFIVFSLILIYKSGQNLKKEQIILLITALLFSINVFLRSSPFLNFFNIFGSIYLLFLYFASYYLYILPLTPMIMTGFLAGSNHLSIFTRLVSLTPMHPRVPPPLDGAI